MTQKRLIIKVKNHSWRLIELKNVDIVRGNKVLENLKIVFNLLRLRF